MATANAMAYNQESLIAVEYRCHACNAMQKQWNHDVRGREAGSSVRLHLSRRWDFTCLSSDGTKVTGAIP